MQTSASFLTAWSNFYVMAGSSAAALTGLMFVVITLVTRTDRPGAQDGISTFSTPTVVHFCAVFLISALAIAPWRTLAYPSAMIGIAGLYGVVYISRLIARTRRLSTAYVPDLEDWAWYSFLPLLAYAALLVAGIALSIAPVAALFVLAGSAVLLIFIGIHNAWDIVTYITIGRMNEPPS
jgi:hypothetical protein